ncbi:MAG: hypothetical protein ABIB93_04990, partial [Chloroflexota bacterium]
PLSYRRAPFLRLFVHQIGKTNEWHYSFGEPAADSFLHSLNFRFIIPGAESPVKVMPMLINQFITPSRDNSFTRTAYQAEQGRSFCEQALQPDAPGILSAS